MNNGKDIIQNSTYRRIFQEKKDQVPKEKKINRWQPPDDLMGALLNKDFIQLHFAKIFSNENFRTEKHSI